jgi:hypothetical protein
LPVAGASFGATFAKFIAADCGLRCVPPGAGGAELVATLTGVEGGFGVGGFLAGGSWSYIVGSISSDIYSTARSRSGVIAAPQFGQKAFSSETGLLHFSQVFM